MGQAAERRACLARQHQVKRFGRRDQNVGRFAKLALTILRGRIAGSDRHAEGGERRATILRSRQDPFERDLKVAMDVVIQRLQRRDVKDADARLFARDAAKDDRGTPGTRPTSCLNPLARKEACSSPRRSPASPASAERSAHRSSIGTSRRTAGSRTPRPFSKPFSVDSISPPGGSMMEPV